MPIWTVPYPRNPLFSGREALLARLENALQPGQATLLSQPTAINGLGGISKTQLALEYAYQHRQDYQAVFWVRADTRENLVADYVAMAGHLYWLLGSSVQTQTHQDRKKKSFPCLQTQAGLCRIRRRY